MNQINPEPLSGKGRMGVALIVLILAAMWALAVHAYLTLPNEIPGHFNFDGEPTRYDAKSTVFVIPAAFSIAPVIFLLVTKYRFTLVNRYPYLINLPAFYTNITKIPEERRGFWVNRYFEALLYLGVFLSFSLFVMELGMYAGDLSGRLPSWFLPFSLLMPILLVVLFLFYLARLSKEMKAEIG